MATLSRIDRLLALLGGEENLPKKKTQVQDEVDVKGDHLPGVDDETDDDCGVPVDIPIKSSTQSESANETSQQAKDVPTSPSIAGTEKPQGINVTFPYEARKGEPSAVGFGFAPFQAVTKYCYKWAPKHLTQPIATTLFDANKIYNDRSWDLYYISSKDTGIQIFVSEEQLQDLIDDINSEFNTHLEITDWNRLDGLVVDFEDLPTKLRPLWLGRCTSRDQYLAWNSRLLFEPMMDLNDRIVSESHLKSFRSKMSAAAAVTKNKYKPRGNKKGGTIARRQEAISSGLRVLQYLGLQAEKNDIGALPDLTDLHIGDTPEQSTTRPPFESDVIFIAIDVEAKERSSSDITEVGVATLDTRDLHGIPHAGNGKEWFKHIRGRHFRTLEHKDHVNHEFIKGCPDKFQFGASEIVSKDDLPKVLTSCFHEPFSRLGGTTTAEQEMPAGTERRNIVIVGHDVGADVRYCRKMGFDIYNRGNLIDTVDTAQMHRMHTQDPNPRSLGQALLDCGIDGWNLHNAGNDAVYTLQTMLALAIKRTSRAASEKEADKSSEE